MAPKNKILSLSILILVASIYTLASCRKSNIRTDGGNIAFSKDTLLFDTVFTATGNATRSVKIINKEKDRMKIESIRLFRGSSSPYFINVNGEMGKSVSNVNIEGNDSVYVFASVYIDPTNQNDPFIVEDHLVVTINGKEFTLPFLAYGQNAIYITDSALQTQTWTKNKPYVIVQNAYVDAGQTLTLEPGTRVYVHADSRLFVMGSLKINGTKSDSVIFQGDRIDRRIYFDEQDFVNGVGGEWGGLYFTKESYNNSINYGVFKNGGASTKLGEGYVADAMIQVDHDTVNNGTPKLNITNSILRNSGGIGLLTFSSSVKAENCLFFASAKENVALTLGGQYELNGCTIASYGRRISTATESHSAFAAQNYFPTGINTYDGNNLSVILRNCIIYGNTQDEFYTDKKDNFAASIQVQNCLIKQQAALPGWVTLQNTLFNLDPLFINTDGSDINANDYHLEDDSPAIGKGVNFANMLSTDLDGKARVNPTTIGCYEY